MPWAKLDDSFPDHPKVRRVGDLGIALFARGLCYASHWLSDGFLPTEVVKEWVRAQGRPGKRTLTLLLQAPPGFRSGLWEVAEGGYQIHDYLEYSPSKEEVQTERRAAKARKNSWRERHSERHPGRDPEQRSERQENGGKNDAHARAPAGALPSRPVPYPSHTSPPTPSPETGGERDSPPGTPGTTGAAPNNGHGLWARVLVSLDSVDPKELKTWFGPTRQIAFEKRDDDFTLTVAVPNRTFADWIMQKHGSALRLVLANLVPEHPVKLRFEVTA